MLNPHTAPQRNQLQRYQECSNEQKSHWRHSRYKLKVALVMQTLRVQVPWAQEGVLPAAVVEAVAVAEPEAASLQRMQESLEAAPLVWEVALPEAASLQAMQEVPVGCQGEFQQPLA
jgi:hypothetical protein